MKFSKFIGCGSMWISMHSWKFCKNRNASKYSKYSRLFIIYLINFCVYLCKNCTNVYNLRWYFWWFYFQYRFLAKKRIQLLYLRCYIDSATIFSLIEQLWHVKCSILQYKFFKSIFLILKISSIFTNMIFYINLGARIFFPSLSLWHFNFN